MSHTKRLYIDGLEHHLVLLEDLRAVSAVGSYLNTPLDSVKGNEDFAAAASALGSGMLSVGKWVGGKTLSAFTSVLGSAGNSLIKRFSDNETLIKKLLQRISREEDKEWSVSKTALAQITAEGEVDDILRDMETLLKTLELLDAHNKDLLSYLDKKLLVAKKLKSVTNTETIFKVVEEFEEVKYPHFKLPNGQSEERASDTLPNGKVIEFHYGEGESPKYLIGGDSPSGAGTSITLSKSELSNLLNKLDKVNSFHKRLKQSYDNYLGHVKAWSEMVKTVDANLSKLEGVSRTAMGEAEKVLAGDANALAFYSGFTPRVVGYTDRYIHGVLGVFA